MKYKIFRQTEQKVSKWAGGTTTELFIYPENSSYLDRNFLFRVSSATVEAEKSEFTHLPGFSRLLMILDGKIEIQHKGKYSKVLKKFDIDEFQGSWETSSQGKAIDFNLMMAEGIQGSLMAHWFILQGSVNLDFAIKNTYTGVYVFKGSAEMFIAEESIILESGDFLIMEGFMQGSIELVAGKNCQIILSSIQITDNVGRPSPSPDTLFSPDRLI